MIEVSVVVDCAARDIVSDCPWESGGDGCRPMPIVFFDHFRKIMARAGVERFEPEVVDNQQSGVIQRFNEVWAGSVRHDQGTALRAVSNADAADFVLTN